MAYLIFGLLVLGGLLLLARWFASAPPSDVIKVIRYGAFAAGTAFLLYLVLGGARTLAFLLAPLLLPLLINARSILNRLKTMTGPSPGQTSTVETRFLRMTLDHDSGAMDGTVREGAYRGRRLDELDETDLLELWRTCRAEDEQSVQVMEAWLDRMHGPGWREAAGVGPDETETETEGAGSTGENDRARAENAGRRGASGGNMTLDEAYKILGLTPDAGEEDIRAAHRKLMRQFHPDSGGSNYLAAKINQAKDLLLRRS
ncbi:DnaJ domain-containing protein [Algihabitans albus]|uniref:DnaJ domain-containing protein n=1 Tax=Algihabitans albus TaxID=2164067 RepID=UPI000E5D804B|nr:DnaJ domain-containing protein [Algihabitans albus]